jgi:hypothetical protein
LSAIGSAASGRNTKKSRDVIWFVPVRMTYHRKFGLEESHRDDEKIS